MKKEQLIIKNRGLLRENNELSRDKRTLEEEVKMLRKEKETSILAHKVSLLESPNPLYMEMTKHKMLMDGERKNKAVLKQEVLDLGKKVKKMKSVLNILNQVEVGKVCWLEANDLNILDFNSFMEGVASVDNRLDNLTTARLSLALKAIGLKISPYNVNCIIDLVDLIVSKGSEAKMDDITKLKEEWRGDLNLMYK